MPLLVLALSLWSCGPCGGGRTRPSLPVDAGPVARPVDLPAERPGRPARAGEALGVNEGVSIPQAWVRDGRVKPEAEPALLAADVRALVGLGAHIVRANTATYPWLSWKAFLAQGGDFTRADNWVRAVHDGGLEPLVMLGPWPGNHTAAHTDAYVPADLPAYQAWVHAVVERYDGDGVDDMPGLARPVRYWEVDNEPDLHNSVPPRGGGATVPPEEFQTPAQYATVLVATSAAIRAADPQAVVLTAGFYRPHRPSGRAWIEALMAQPGVPASFDVLSLHCYFHEDSLDALTRALSTWRATAPGKPLWVTETAVPSVGDEAHIDEAWQGRMVAATVGLLLAGGADRIFWHTLADPPPSTPDRARSPFATHSLLQSGEGDAPPRSKPAGQVYRRLAERLDDLDPDSLVEVPAPGGRLLRAGDGWLAFWGTPAVPPGAALATDLLTGQTTPAGPAVRAPAWLAPAP